MVPFRTEAKEHSGREADDLLRQIETEELTPELLHRALEEPNERPLLKALETVDPIKLSREDRVRVYARAMRDAKVDGEVWTPVLDRLAKKVLMWPSLRDMEEFVSEDDDEVPHRSPAQQADLLEPWIARQHDPEELRPLLAFNAAWVHQALARNAQAIDLALARELLDREERYESIMSTLTRNPNLPSEVGNELLREARLQEGQDAYSPRSRFLTLTRGLARGGHQLPARERSEAVRACASQPHGGYADIATALAPQLGISELERVYQNAGKETKAKILVEEGVPTTFCVEKLDEAQGSELFELRKGLAKDPERRQDPEIRRRLLATSSKEVLQELLETSDPEERNEVLRLLARKHPKVIPQILSPHQGLRRWGPPPMDEDKDRGPTAEELVKHYMPAIVDGLLRAGSRPAIRDTLDHDRSQTALREALINDTLNVDTAKNLLVDARGEEMRRILRRMGEPSPNPTASPAQEHARLVRRQYDTLRFLTETEPPGLADVEAEDLAPMLASESEKVRTLAFTLLDRVQREGLSELESPEPKADPPTP